MVETKPPKPTPMLREGVGETWLPVPGYEQSYSVSDQGRVRSEFRLITYSKGSRQGQQRVWNERILKGSPDSAGYPTYSLWKEGRQKSFRGHVLVLLAFAGKPEPGQEGLHRDDVKANNKLSNLRWGTRIENVHDQIRNTGHYRSRGDTCINGHERTAENILIESDGVYRCQQCKAEHYQRTYKPHPRKPKTHCPKGHKYTPENTFIRKRSGVKECRTCMRDRNKQNYWNKKKEV